jgi:NADH dehydrogenase [ubiquinone] 1 alpha subcomplex assembly factor 7
VTELEKLLRVRMESEGPLTVAQYMAEALSHPQWGYYMRRNPLGRDGDFITAPEISQVFGELLGLWCLDYWQRLGSPDSFLLVEAGPGRGTMMVDALRAASLDPTFLAAARVHLVENSPALRERQREALCNHEVTWVDSLEGISDEGPILLLANEFLDALPVHQFERVDNGWRERLVGLNPGTGGEKGDFCFCLCDETVSLPDALDTPEITQAPLGSIAETCPGALAFVSRLSARLCRHGGAALMVDYGHSGYGTGDSLQALRDHRPCSVLEEPGAADITAHVDFSALSEAAIVAGAHVHGPRRQGAFLRELGIEARSARLAETAPEEARRLLESSCRRLISEGEMGTLFKVVALTGVSQPVPAGF